MELSDLPDGALAVVLDHVARGPDGISDVARASCVNRHFHAMALDRQRRMRTLDVRSLGRRARHAVPHIARRCTSLRRVFCDRTNITDECVTALLTTSALTLERIVKRSLAVRQSVAARLLKLAKNGAVVILPSAPGPPIPRTSAAEEVEAFRASQLRLTCAAGFAGAPQVTIPAAALVGNDLLSGPASR